MIWQILATVALLAAPTGYVVYRSAFNAYSRELNMGEAVGGVLILLAMATAVLGAISYIWGM